MNDTGSRLPHFLRVARSLAKVSGVALPLVTVFVTVVPGVGTGCSDGVDAMSSGGYGGGFPGVRIMDPDGGSDGSAVGDAATPDAGYDGSAVGDMVMPDDAGH